MNILCKHIMNELPNAIIYSLGEDEIIIEVPSFGCGFSLNQLKKVVSSCQDGIGNMVRVEHFTLNKINAGWIKSYSDNAGTVEFKCVDAEIYHQIIKHFYGLPITENDLVFYHNGQLAKFLKEVENPWS